MGLDLPIEKRAPPPADCFFQQRTELGKTEEVEVNTFSKLLSSLKTKANFQFKNFQMEVSSTCKACN